MIGTTQVGASACEPRKIDGRRVAGCVLDHEWDRMALEECLKPLAGRVLQVTGHIAQIADAPSRQPARSSSRPIDSEAETYCCGEAANSSA